MKTQEEWLALVTPGTPWKPRYQAIHDEIVNALATVEPDAPLSSKALVALLLPDPRGPEGGKLVHRIHRAIDGLTSMAEPGLSLDGCYTLEPGQSIYHKPIMRKLWHRANLTPPPVTSLEDVRVSIDAYLSSNKEDPLLSSLDLRIRMSAILDYYLPDGDQD